MILYKYVSHESGMKMLENNTIGFSKPRDFNDPFEVEASTPTGNSGDFFQPLIDHTKKAIIKDQTGILSLTRQPLNALMWAHYGDEHKGMVIGIDCSISDFTSEASNLIPIQYGNVIYTDTKPSHDFLGEQAEPFKLGSTFKFSCSHFEELQRMYLHKPMCWSYEEEVRLVKCIKGVEENEVIQSGKFKILDLGDRSIYLQNLPEGSIKEVYVGARSNNEENNALLDRLLELQPSAKAYRCNISSTSWTLTKKTLKNIPPPPGIGEGIGMLNKSVKEK